MSMKISEGADIQGLVTSLITAAVKELLFGNPLQQIAAFEFLASRDFEIYASIAPIQFEKLLQNPQRARDALENPYRSNKNGTGNKRQRI